MDRRGQFGGAASGQYDLQTEILTASIAAAALIKLGAQEDVAERFANDYVKTNNYDKPHEISSEHAQQQYVTDAVNQLASQVFDTLCQETERLEEFEKNYIQMFFKKPYLGLPIGEMLLFDQVKEVKHRIEVLKQAISSRHPIPDEPIQQMGAGLPPPIFCTGSNHCAIASMLSLISVTCMLLGYNGNAPPRSFSIRLGNAFKDFLNVKHERCIVIEGIFTNLNVFLQLLGEQYPPYAPFLDRIFSLFSSKTFSKNTDGTCSLHEGSNEVLSSLKMLEDSTKSLGDRLQHELLSCGSEQFHSHLQMKPGVISAFGLPCAGLDIDLSTGVVRGLLPQIPFTAESMASFQLFGKTVGSGLQFDIASNLFAAICDTRGRNQNFGAEDAQNVGTSHYYLLIRTGDYRYFFVDSSRTNVHEISQDIFLRNLNENGIVIFMRNSVEQEAPQQVAKISSQSPPSVRKHSTGSAAAVPAPTALPCRKHSASGGSAAVPAPAALPCRKPSAGGGAAAVLHQQQCSFVHSQPQFNPRKPAYPSSQIVVFDGSGISGLKSKFALYDAVIRVAKLSGLSTSSFKLTDLTLVKRDLETACKNGVQVFGSFITSEDGKPEDRFRAVGFQLEDGTVVNHTGTASSLSDATTKDDFVRRVQEKWQSSIITAITFALCT